MTVYLVDNETGKTAIVPSEEKALFLLACLNELFPQEAEKHRQENHGFERFAYETHSLGLDAILLA